MRLEVPCLIELGMVTCFNNPEREVDVLYVLVHSRITKEHAGEIVAVDLGACPFDTYLGSKKFETGQVGLHTIVTFEGSLLHLAVYKSIM